MNKANKSIHLAWLSALLAAALVASLTARFGQVDNILNYLGFAATISSIILSVIAITYTFVSSGASNAIQANLVKTSSEISNQTSDMTQLYQRIENLMGGIPDKVDALHKAIDDSMRQAGDFTLPAPKTGNRFDFEMMKSYSPLFLIVGYFALGILQKANKAIQLDIFSKLVRTVGPKSTKEYYMGSLKTLRGVGVIYFDQVDDLYFNFRFYENDFGAFSQGHCPRESKRTFSWKNAPRCI